jgi:hypothetical protein
MRVEDVIHKNGKFLIDEVTKFKIRVYQSELVKDALEDMKKVPVNPIAMEFGLDDSSVILEWAYQVHTIDQAPVLIIENLINHPLYASLAHKNQVEMEFPKSVDEVISGINVINYESLHKFDPEQFTSIALSIQHLIRENSLPNKTLKIINFLRKAENRLITVPDPTTEHLLRFLAFLNKRLSFDKG